MTWTKRCPDISASKDIALYEAPLGDDAHRVTTACQQFQDLTCDAQIALYGLVRVGVGAERNGAATVSRSAQLPGEQNGSVWLCEQAGLEIQSGGEPQIGVAGARKAVNAPVLTAPVWVDRLLERDIR
jgi:hypothetical protein